MGFRLVGVNAPPAAQQPLVNGIHSLFVGCVQLFHTLMRVADGGAARKRPKLRQLPQDALAAAQKIVKAGFGISEKGKQYEFLRVFVVEYLPFACAGVKLEPAPNLGALLRRCLRIRLKKQHAVFKVVHVFQGGFHKKLLEVFVSGELLDGKLLSRALERLLSAGIAVRRSGFSLLCRQQLGQG